MAPSSPSQLIGRVRWLSIVVLIPGSDLAVSSPLGFAIGKAQMFIARGYPYLYVFAVIVLRIIAVGREDADQYLSVRFCYR